MSEYSYIRLNRFMHNHPAFSKTLVILCKAITGGVYVFYPLFLILSFYLSRLAALKLALVPLISIIVLSVFRAKLNLKRPYEELAITPLYNKKTEGKSFPSRHTFAIFIIAFSTYFFSHLLFWVLTFSGIVLAILRVLLGVHYVRDVLAGFLCAIISALIGYIII